MKRAIGYVGPPEACSTMDELARIAEGLARIENPRGLLEGLFAHAPVGFQIYNAEGRSLLVNQAFLRLFGSAPPPEYSILRDEIAERNGVASLIRLVNRFWDRRPTRAVSAVPLSERS